METFTNKLHRWEFEARIFVSFAIVILVCGLSFALFPHSPSTLVLAGRLFGLSEGTVLTFGYAMIAALMGVVSALRMWAGSALTARRVMAFRIQADTLQTGGPYRFVRNPIYLADFAAMCAFALCLPPAGLLMPLLFYAHYVRLIQYEELSFRRHFDTQYAAYASHVPRLIPSIRCLLGLVPAFREFRINSEGFRHNALYLLFVPGFIIAAHSREFLHAVIVGLPAVVDWATVHIQLGVEKKRT